VINYINGDATQPVGEGPKFIVHVCNNVGLWGAGFVLALSRRWAEPEEAYYVMGERCNGYSLGNVEAVEVDDDLWVINMIGQSGVGSNNGIPPIRYKAIRQCLEQVAEMACSVRFRGVYKAVAVHAPRFGAGLAGGDWNEIEKIINETLIAAGVPVTVYDFAG
jgi:O-acetyl-ADP-ribose deacetylase (regulator of RNase III)